MNICFPVKSDQGLGSEIYGHFASAPFFLVVDTDGKTCSIIANCSPDSPFAGCNPFSALRGRQLDGIVVDAIGDDAVRTMNLCGFTVYHAGSTSVSENIESFANGDLSEVLVQQSHLEGRCTAAESGHGCNHHEHH
jgi:predicted Fe-Mo cluster-binding NifX family protein